MALSSAPHADFFPDRRRGQCHLSWNKAGDCPTLWVRWSQRLEVTSGKLLPDQPVPLLKRRWELDQEEALRL